jgi:hypothetical protein
VDGLQKWQFHPVGLRADQFFSGTQSRKQRAIGGRMKKKYSGATFS